MDPDVGVERVIFSDNWVWTSELFSLIEEETERERPQPLFNKNKRLNERTSKYKKLQELKCSSPNPYQSFFFYSSVIIVVDPWNSRFIKFGWIDQFEPTHLEILDLLVPKIIVLDIRPQQLTTRLSLSSFFFITIL